MSTPASVPGRMKKTIPENGYESPLPSPHGGSEFFPRPKLVRHERHRLAYMHQGAEPPVDGERRGSQTNTIDEGGETQQSEAGEKSTRVGFRDRIGCYTWTWFTMNMATGGIANVLHSIPYRSEWLRVLGLVVVFFNLLLFSMNCTFLTLRFRWNPGSFLHSFLSPSESLFIPACVVSSGTILINMCQYGIPRTGEWFQTAMQVCFWTYASVAVLTSSSIFLIIWSTQTFPIHTMTPIWIFPAYPLLLTAPLAANFIDALPSAEAASRVNSLTIALAAVCLQGTGFLVSLMVLSAFIYRLMTQKIPREPARPGMFVSVGPSGFTVAGIVHLGNVVNTKVMPEGYMGNASAGFFFKLLADVLGLWMWGLCLWFFLVSVGAHLQLMRRKQPGREIRFDMTWYSFVFPNTAMITATQAVGRTFEARAIQIMGTVMAVLLVLVWGFVFGTMLRAFWLRKLLWPEEGQGPGQLEKIPTVVEKLPVAQSSAVGRREQT